ncbi:hypothetical protein N7448_010501 [Penicillium atrosanguineum]|uniref:Uncharacterized protein n=1 Tax=Penicillium atrosanguineum TaxID=1132637 RepID=A0A9W9PM43_9EURO|nr:uncharacterized protein N7443_007724 [Penicillium atrosanguineum]KAJ5118794.1 hypothetical protein N7526_010431 [Penicillium atrosanguineum]KAJ5119832.1 hypothetical protein N7448_010501 [Penicillium atrosanguineum]KAJ5296831.1 hypothetical protein N7443_007724 [Penicillium atrosanguineum]KAJ5299591.1 hypothetical protein N7476_011148 [Penicillium atrosanguineum]
MFAPPGSPDVLTLATFAYQVYDTYKGAPKRFKDLAGDIKGLEILLRRLGNRLALQQGDVTDENSRGSLLSSDEAAGLEQLVKQAGNMLEELQQKQGYASAPRGLNRFRWSQGEVDSVRSRITSLCAIIGAFNSGLVLPNIASRDPVVDKQQEILDKLDNFLLGLHRDDLSSTISVTSSNTPTVPKIEEEVTPEWPKLVRRMTEYGISEAEAEKNQDLIMKWSARAYESAASSPLKQSPNANALVGSVSADLGLGGHTEEIEVISAVYGPKIVTDIVRHIIHVHAGLKMTKVVFSVTNDTFGGDPWLNNIKAFSMVWRKVIRLDYGNLYSAPQKLFAEEDELLTLDLSIPLPCHESPETNERGSIYILNASWHNVDVTDHVALITADDPRPNITASNHEFFATDPCYGHKKVMSVTWAYSNTAAALSHCEAKTVIEDSSAQIPPFLDIICANWGGLDITNLVRAKITSQQTLHFDTRNVCAFASPDPLPGWQKTISILYRYGSVEPMQLLVTGEDSGDAMIEPGDRMRRNFFFSNFIEITSDIKVMAAVWGLQPVSEKGFGRAVREGKEVPCNNDFFGRDGWGGRRKTLQVFLQNGHTGECVCVSAKEGNILGMPTVWPEY